MMRHCDLDPVPTKLLMQCLPELLHIISYIVNTSLETGVFPHHLKEAMVRPCLKKADLDSETLNNYRPISNLAFISKIIEKCVAKQLSHYLELNNLLSKFQSGYRKFHSCETATTRIHNDILIMCDARSKVVLLLLDLSAAFDTVNHSLLLKKLNTLYGINGKVLQWCKSYLTGRSFTVKINNTSSDTVTLTVGVPQGSILGPLLFILYTKDLETIALAHGFEIHLYADDTQLYLTFDSINSCNIEQRIIDCMCDIRLWMLKNFLKLNESKTDVIIISSKHDSSENTTTLKINAEGTSSIVNTDVKSLGIHLDEKLSMTTHISTTIQTCNMHLRNLWYLASKLTLPLKIQMTHAMILSRLDYCNCVLYGITSKDLARLQKVQNSAVRFIFGKGKRSHVTQLLKKVHFLPVKQRIMFKIALMVFKCINNIAPIYLQELIALRNPKLNYLRVDNDFFFLETPPAPTLASTQKAFSYAGPKVWNVLPYCVRASENVVIFKKRLKSHYFTQVFGE